MSTTKELKFKFYTDPGHGWVAVKKSLLVELGIDKDISRYSYVKGQTAYLEEDCDAAKLVKALDNKGIKYSFESKNTNSSSPIRSYDRYLSSIE